MWRLRRQILTNYIIRFVDGIIAYGTTKVVYSRLKFNKLTKLMFKNQISGYTQID